MKLRLRLLLMGIAGLAVSPGKATAQISLLQDYKNYTSKAIGTFQGINFRESGFSGMFSIPNTNGKEFWICSDRGVNIDAGNANPSGCTPTYDKIYAFPGYAPKIHRVRVHGDSVQILQTISIKRPGGTDATGIINPTGFGSTAAEVPSTDTVQNCINFNAKTVAKDVWGIDAEGILVDKDGFFWICEEGGPTVWKLDQNGVVIKRFSPYASQPGAPSIDVQIDTVFRYRKNNRGFEGISIAPNGKIYAIIQSPILFPSKSVGENTRVHRILEIDPATNATRMFAYLNDGIIGSGSNQIRLRDWKIGDMAAINDTTFLVMEAASRGTTDIKRIYKINIATASVVHSGLYGGVTLEALVDSTGLATNGILPVKKTLFMDLLANGWNPALDKAEGLAIVNDSTIVICNDNDYGQYSILEDGIATATGNLSHLVKYGLHGVNKLVNYQATVPMLVPGMTGPSTATTPYLVPTTTDGKFTSILTAGEVVGGYKMVGLPDGLGAFDNNDGTFSLVMNHELGNTSGVARAHGQKGSFVSKWTINKSDLSVVNISDLMQNVNLWNPITSSYITYNSSFPSTSTAFNRFCSADLPAPSAFYNSLTGKGTQERIFMNGEESGNEGRAMAHIITGLAGGTSYELPRLGKFSWENSLASPKVSDTTVVIGLDDATPGQIYVYVGTKTNTGTDVDKAGLTNGKLFGVAVSGMVAESDVAPPAPGTPFSLIDMGNVQNMTGLALQNASNTAGVSAFLRPEDGAWDPQSPNDFYFATTNGFTANSRLWRLRFVDAANPALGGNITAVLDGTEGQKMMDNIGIDHYGHILIVEDVGNNAHIGKTWQYTIATDELKQVASHDTTRFLSGGTNYLTQDEEASGIIDVESILGPGMFLTVDQAHYGVGGEVVEGGQLLAFFNPDTYNAAPEAEVSGNTIAIASGDVTPSVLDNTHFGSVYTGTSQSRDFVIGNSGAGSLTVSAINFMGADASLFTVSGAPSFPLTIAPHTTQMFTVSFAPLAGGMANATISLVTNDVDESAYNYAISGNGVDSPEVFIQGNGIDIVDGDATPGTANYTDFGSVNIGSAYTNDFVIGNTGHGNLAVSAINFTGAHAADFMVTGTTTYPVIIPSGGTYTVTVQFMPTSGGVRNATLNVVSNDADEANYDFAVKGTGVYLPEINVKGNGNNIVDGDPTPGIATNTDFGTVVTTASQNRTFVIQNPSMGVLTVSGITFTGTDAADFTLFGAPGFPWTIAAGDTQIITVKFAPTTGGAKTATINIENNDADESTYDFALAGTGVALPEITIEGNGIEITDGDLTPGTANNTDFGSTIMGSLAIKYFKIHNTGMGNLSVSGISFTGATEFTLVSVPSMPAIIAPGDSASIAVQFAPVAVGSRSAEIHILSNDADEATYNFALQGEGTGMPEITVQSDTMTITDGDATAGTANNTDFGVVNIGVAATKNYQIKNLGAGPLSVTGITFTGANASEFTLYGAPGFPMTVAPGGSQSISVQFQPTASGVRYATINIANSDSDEGVYDFVLQGTGVSSTSVQDLGQAASLKLYPNPTGNNATLAITINANTEVTIRVTDVQGKEMMPSIAKKLNVGENLIDLNTSSLTNGVYFLQITDGKSSTNAKMVIMH